MKGRHRAALEAALRTALRVLASDTLLAQKFRDHSLSGEWSGFRDCHVKPDLVPVYEKPTPETLRLVRLGSHSELGF